MFDCGFFIQIYIVQLNEEKNYNNFKYYKIVSIIILL